MHTHSIDVFKKGVWPEFADIDDPELKVLPKALPIALFCRAATIKKYSGAFVRWKKWTASKADLEAFPAKPMQVALYLSFLTSKSKEPITAEILHKLVEEAIDDKGELPAVI